MFDLPGWDSLEAVARYHRFAEITGIVALAILVIAEVVTYRYGHRKDDLAAQQQEATDKRHDEEMARLHRETAELTADAQKSRARAAEAELALEKLKTPRTLGTSRQKFVADAVRPYAGRRYTASVSQGADDGIAFWESLYTALHSAGWVYIPPGPDAFTVGSPGAGIPISASPGVEILFNPAKEAELTTPALALGNALHADGTVVNVNRDSTVHQSENEQDIILIRIGARVPRE